MSDKAQLLLDILHAEYIKRIDSGNYTEDGARMFDINKICETNSLDHSLMDDLTSELKQCGYIQKWITGTIVLLED